jgi:hypothetical protein
MIHRESGILNNFRINAVSNNIFPKNIIFLNLSRDAIFSILENESITSKDKVLMPDFMCHTLVDVVKSKTDQILTYSLNRDLSINENSFLHNIKQKPKIVFIVDYFGIITHVSMRIKELILDKDVIVIRDMAHSFLTLHQYGYKVDNYSDYVVSSIYKSLKLYSGSILFVKNENRMFNKNYIGVFPVINGLVKNIIKEVLYYLGFNYKRIKTQCSSEEYLKKTYGFNIYFFYKFVLKKINIDQIVFNRNLVSIEFYKIMEKSHIVSSLFNINQIENNVLQAFPIVFNNKNNRDLIQKILREKCVDAYTWPQPHCLFDSNKLGDRVLLIPVNKRVVVTLKEVLRCLDM